MIFKEFYIPHYIEYLFDFFGKYQIKTNKKYTQENKEKVLNSILTLLNQRIIFVGNWIDNNNFKRWNLSNKEIIEKINSLWLEGTEYPELYNIVYFNYEEWYIDELEKLGFNENSNWDTFIKENIGNLEKWIEENRPKE